MWFSYSYPWISWLGAFILYALSLNGAFLLYFTVGSYFQISLVTQDNWYQTQHKGKLNSATKRLQAYCCEDTTSAIFFCESELKGVQIMIFNLHGVISGCHTSFMNLSSMVDSWRPQQQKLNHGPYVLHPMSQKVSYDKQCKTQRTQNTFWILQSPLQVMRSTLWYIHRFAAPRWGVNTINYEKKRRKANICTVKASLRWVFTEKFLIVAMDDFCVNVVRSGQWAVSVSVSTSVQSDTLHADPSGSSDKAGLPV